MSDICIFKRVEKKYILDTDEKDVFLAEIIQHLIPDLHGKSTICSLYLDTPDFLIIRNSINGKVYKEKLRLRCYGVPKTEDKVFLEIKKKFKGVVYKRRVAMPLETAYKYIDSRIKPFESQIMSEIDYAMDYYKSPKPMVLIAYEREAYFVKNFPNLRITFDTNVRYRTNDLYLENGNQGKKIIPDDFYIMEIKTDGAMPIWLAEALNKHKIYPRSFSKYGTSYLEFSQKTGKPKGEKEYATV